MHLLLYRTASRPLLDLYKLLYLYPELDLEDLWVASHSYGRWLSLGLYKASRPPVVVEGVNYIASAPVLRKLPLSFAIHAGSWGCIADMGSLSCC